jgi:hypothetical protein
MSAFDHPLWRNAMTSIQSDVEDMGADELRERAMDIRLASEQEQISSTDRMTFTLMVFAAILRPTFPETDGADAGRLAQRDWHFSP